MRFWVIKNQFSWYNRIVLVEHLRQAFIAHLAEFYDIIELRTSHVLDALREPLQRPTTRSVKPKAEYFPTGETPEQEVLQVEVELSRMSRRF